MTPQAIDSGNKEELREELLKIKARQKRLQDDTKEKTARTVSTVVTIGSALGLSYLMGGKEKEAREAAGGDAQFDALTPQQKEDKLKEKQSVMGFDLDLLVGVGAIALGLTDSAGAEWSGPLAAVGTGALSSFASRQAYLKAAHAVDEVKQP